MNRVSQPAMHQETADQDQPPSGTAVAGDGDLGLDLGDTKALALIWEAPRGAHRTVFLGRHLGMEVRHIYVTRRKGWYLAPFKYLSQTLMTLALLARERYQLVLVQSPPIFAVLAVWLYSLFAKTCFIIDAHTGSLLAPFWQWSLPLHRFLSRRAITTVVTNEHLRQLVSTWGGSSFLLRDVPVVVPFRTVNRYPEVEFAVAFVSSYCYDEPLDQVLLAAEALPGFTFYVTGDFESGSISGLAEAAPDNVHFTGYLPAAEFFGLLEAVQVVMSLTTNDHTMQSGASEALWLGKPVITSDWPLLRAYFDKGAILVDNSAACIQQALTKMKDDLPVFEAGIRALRQERRREWLDRAGALVQLVQESGLC